MKFVIKKVIKLLAQSEWGWKLIESTLMLAASYAEAVRREVVPPQIGTADPQDIELVSKELIVKHGPFKGMKYPSAVSFGSTLLPKLLGSYEREIQHIVEEICQTPYSTIIVVGCGEGYYAVGLAIRIPGSKVYAYDIEPIAQELCRQLAQSNGVSDRVTIESFCSPETLKSFSFDRRTLIFCDCEGYEKELFTPEVLPMLANCDLLIELHDWYDITISSYISDLFKETHEQVYVESVDDIKKAKTYDYMEIAALDLSHKKRILAENRFAVMEWVFLRAKSNQL